MSSSYPKSKAFFTFLLNIVHEHKNIIRMRHRQWGHDQSDIHTLLASYHQFILLELHQLWLVTLQSERLGRAVRVGKRDVLVSRTDGSGGGYLVSFTDDRQGSVSVDHPALHDQAVLGVDYVNHVVVRARVSRFVQQFYFLYRARQQHELSVRIHLEEGGLDAQFILLHQKIRPLFVKIRGFFFA